MREGYVAQHSPGRRGWAERAKKKILTICEKALAESEPSGNKCELPERGKGQADLYCERKRDAKLEKRSFSRRFPACSESPANQTPLHADCLALLRS